MKGPSGSLPGSRPTWRIPSFIAASAAIAAVVGVTVWGGSSSNGDSGASIRLPVARMMVPVSYASQAQQVAFFEPLADRASLSTISVVSEQSIGGAARPIPSYPRAQIDNAMAVTGGSGQ